MLDRTIACARKELGLLDCLHHWNEILLIILAIIFLRFFLKRVLLKLKGLLNLRNIVKKFNISSLISFIATYTVFIGLLAYTLYYLPYERFFPYLARNENEIESISEFVIKTLKHPSLYSEFATFATLGGLFALLSDNRRKHKEKKKSGMSWVFYKLCIRNRSKNQILQVQIREKDAKIAELERLMQIHWIPLEESTKTKL